MRLSPSPAKNPRSRATLKVLGEVVQNEQSQTRRPPPGVLLQAHPGPLLLLHCPDARNPGEVPLRWPPCSARREPPATDGEQDRGAGARVLAQPLIPRKGFLQNGKQAPVSCLLGAVMGVWGLSRSAPLVEEFVL